MSGTDDSSSHQKNVAVFTDAAIRVGLIAVVAFLCLRVFTPFIGLMLWALILAVAIYPLHLKLAKKLKGKQGLSATVIVLIGLLIIGGPTLMIGKSFATHLQSVYTKFESGKIDISPPKTSVSEWPIVGEKVYGAWSAAAKDLPEFVESVRPELETASKKVVAVSAATVGSIFGFLGSLIIAGIMMAYGESGGQAMLKVFQRFSNPSKGTQLHKLSVGTIRSVASGVLGVAFIQALLLGVGFILAGVPGGGVLAFIVLILGVVQLPAALVSIPVVVYLWTGGDASTTSNIIFTVYLLVAGLADNVLKPILLGRGVDAPMPVVLIGALGGMVVSGIIGLFLGAVLLAVGYEIFMAWVNASDEQPANTDMQN